MCHTRLSITQYLVLVSLMVPVSMHSHLSPTAKFTYPERIAALLDITHSGELKPMMPTPRLASRPS